MKVILILSGGMDSTTLLYDMLNSGHEVKCLSIDYGQRHRKELDGAKQICKDIGLDHRIADLSGIKQFLKGSSQTDDTINVPEGHYEEESMKLTVVPNRNMIMLSIACAWAISEKYDAVAYGCHAGDHAIYPDCREEFTDIMARAFHLCDWHKVMLYRPYVSYSKGKIACIGKELNVPYGKTWTCYVGGDKPCGKCGCCNERREAFEFANMKDPLLSN